MYVEIVVIIIRIKDLKDPFIISESCTGICVSAIRLADDLLVQTLAKPFVWHNSQHDICPY